MSKKNYNLDRKLTLLNPVETVNSVGETGLTMETYRCFVPCNKRDLLGKEDTPGERLTGFQQSIFTVRYDAGIRQAMVIDFEGKRYNILSIQESEERRQYSHLKAEYHD